MKKLLSWLLMEQSWKVIIMREKKNAPLVIFFHGFRGHSYVDGVPIYKIAQKEKWNVLLVSMRAHDESEGNIFLHWE